mmetsp:Transcript_1101/g.1444  ORF Transcript_1101/g.1444 Transcript_1101/m.1444 type:complete len:361 (+) Transcript_1101:318-1400(+)
MCFFSKFDIQLNFVALTVLRIFVYFYLFILGCVIADNDHLPQAFGGDIIGLGAGLIILSLCSCVNTPIGFFGSKYHNKFVLSVFYCGELILLPLQLLVGVLLLVHTFPKYPYDFQNDCMSYNLPEMDYSTCKTYYKDDRTAGFKLVWLSYYERSQDFSTKAKYYDRIVNLQKTGLCCGFGRPYSCNPDNRTFPGDLVKYQIDESWRTQRILCGYERPFYPNTTACNSPVDSTEVGSPIGGCYFDYTLGDCANNDVGIDSKGCAATVEETMNSWVSVQAYIAICLTIVQMTSIFMACCMCWKKRDDDVLPGYMQEVASDPYLKVDNDILIGSQIKTSHFKPQPPRAKKKKNKAQPPSGGAG